MLYFALSWVLLAALPGGSGDGLRRDLASDDVAEVEIGGPASDTESADLAAPAASLSYEDLHQAPPPQNPPPPPPPPPNRPEAHVVAVEPPYPVTFSIYGRIPFPLGAVRFGVPGGATEQRIRYDDLFQEHGYGGGLELAFLKSSTEREDVEAKDQEGHPPQPIPPVDRHASGLYLAGQFDAFQGATVATAVGDLKTDRMNTESMFIGYKDHEPWGRGFFTELRVGGGAMHYASLHATLGSRGLELFRNTWGPAGEVAARVGLNLGGSLTIFIGGEGFAAQGPRPAKGLLLTADTNTFFVASAEAGLEFGF